MRQQFGLIAEQVAEVVEERSRSLRPRVVSSNHSELRRLMVCSRRPWMPVSGCRPSRAGSPIAAAAAASAFDLTSWRDFENFAL
jgi:hypothetical protein